MSVKFVDLEGTFYPNKIDLRPGVTNPDAAVYQVNSNFELNVDYENRGTGASADSYIAKASDVNAVQDAVLAVQRTLGQSPEGSSATVSARIGAVETTLADETLYDDRFGGAGWTELDPKPTILSHKHTGEVGAPSKIALATETDGELPKARLQLDATDDDPLLAEHILYAKAAGAASVKTKLDGKLDLAAGGTVAGNTIFSGLLNTTLFAQINVKDLALGSGDVVVSDNYAWCGSALKFSSTANILATTTYVASPSLMFGDYSIALRAKVSANTSTSDIVRIRICEKTGASTYTQISQRTIKANEFPTANEYYSFYLPCTHRFGGVDKKLYIQIFYLGNTIATVDMDSLVAMPVVIAVWGRGGATNVPVW